MNVSGYKDAALCFQVGTEMENQMEQEMRWVICPVCSSKTRLKLRRDTVIHNFLLYCPKCRQERLINVREFQIEVIEK